MILYVTGNLFQSPAQVLVNTVNTVGAMGKGVALTFKRLYPEMFKEYRELCESHRLKVGTLYLYKSPNKWVLNFPTKEHWRNPSKVEYIDAGLRKFASTYGDMGIHSVAFPPLGSGHGQLDFMSQVQPIMEKHLKDLPIDVFIYPAFGTGKEPPEHLQPRQMSDWLRSEPTSLPFSEVWRDLTALLRDRQEFVTVAKGNAFTAILSKDEAGISIESSGQRYQINEESLIAFWQQLRNHGYSTRKIKPGESKTIYYLVPIFSSLPYVSPVELSETYEQLAHTPSIGLQVLPVAFGRHTNPRQLSLMEVDQ